MKFKTSLIVPVLTLGFGAVSAEATDVDVTGLFAGKAMVVINGGRPRMLAAGQTSPEGVKLIAADSGSATLEIDGKKKTLAMGQSISTASGNGSNASVTLTADSRGHFFTTGSVNGWPVKFLVDTGATSVTLSKIQALAMGLDLKNAPRSASMTASSYVNTYRVVLNNVKIGDISLNLVEASIIDGMPGDSALLGNTFLSRLEMKREGSALTLTKTY